MGKPFKKAAEEAEKKGVGSYQRHIFLCTGPDCCSRAEGDRSWGRLKKRLGELDKDRTVYRTKVGCLRLCEQGPIAVVYPDGTWYAGMDCDAIDRVVTEHLLGGEPVADHVIAGNPLPPAPTIDPV